MRKAVLLCAFLLVPALSGCTDDPRVTANCDKDEPNPTATWTTSKGFFTIEIFLDKVPITAGNFIDLATDGFYNGTRFHRVIDDFMIQDGDPYSKNTSRKAQWGTGGPGYTIVDEFCPNLRHDGPGILSMANSGRNTGGSQYFITLVPTPHLDDKHAIFGEVTSGMEVVRAIGDVATDSNDRPIQDVVISGIVISPASSS